MSFAKPFAKRDDDEGAYAALMCKAHECPNRWSVSSKMLCGAHAWAEPHNWSMITTRELQSFARRSAPPPPPKPVEPMTMEQKMAVVAKLRDLASPSTDYKLWARKLKARELAGEKLSNLQQKAWRGALNEPL
jgi:hypothetical protein